MSQRATTFERGEGAQRILSWRLATLNTATLGGQPPGTWNGRQNSSWCVLRAPKENACPQEKVKGIGPHAITRPQNTRGPTDQLSSLGKRKDCNSMGNRTAKRLETGLGVVEERSQEQQKLEKQGIEPRTLRNHEHAKRTRYQLRHFPFSTNPCSYMRCVVY